MSDELISGVLPQDLNSNPIQVLAPGSTIVAATSGTSASQAVPGSAAGRVIRVAVTQDTYIAFGASGVTASSSDILVPAGAEYFQVPADTGFIAYIQVTAAGRISVSEMV